MIEKERAQALINNESVSDVEYVSNWMGQWISTFCAFGFAFDKWLIEVIKNGVKEKLA